MNNNLRLIRRVEGPLGSLRLYQHARVGLAEVVEVPQGKCQVIDVRRHQDELLPSLLRYVDEVQRGVDDRKVQKHKATNRSRSCHQRRRQVTRRSRNAKDDQ